MITAKALAATVALIEHATEARASLPVLRHVRITSPRGGPLLVEGTDLEIHARAALGEHDEIDIVVDPGELRAALGTLPSDGPVTLREDKDKGTLAVRNCATEAFIGLGGSATDFPPMMREATAVAVDIDPSMLRGAMAFAVSCASEDFTRQFLCSVLLGVEPTVDMGERLVPGGGMTLRAVATDGHRMAVAERPMPMGMATIEPRLVPAGACHYLVRALKGADSARIGMDGRSLTVHIDGGIAGGGGEVRVKLIDATFPPWRQVMPRSSATEHEIDRRQFAWLCRQLAPLAGKGAIAARAGLRLVAGETPRIGIGNGYDGNVVAPPKTWRDMPFARRTRCEAEAPTEIGVSIRYLREALVALESDSVWMGLNGQIDPILLSSAADGEGDRIVIMPMRL